MRLESEPVVMAVDGRQVPGLRADLDICLDLGLEGRGMACPSGWWDGLLGKRLGVSQLLGLSGKHDNCDDVISSGLQ